jgi:hypothetical protein
MTILRGLRGPICPTPSIPAAADHLPKSHINTMPTRTNEVGSRVLAEILYAATDCRLRWQMEHPPHNSLRSGKGLASRLRKSVMWVCSGDVDDLEDFLIAVFAIRGFFSTRTLFIRAVSLASISSGSVYFLIVNHQPLLGTFSGLSGRVIWPASGILVQKTRGPHFADRQCEIK